MFHCKTRNSGFSIVELMIAVAMTGIVIAGITNMLSVFGRELRNSNAKLNANSVAQEVRNNLVSMSTCGKILQNVTIDPSKKTSIDLLVPPQMRLAAGVVLKAEGLYIQDLYFDKGQNIGASAIGKPIYLTNLIMSSAVYEAGSADKKGRQFSDILIANLSLELSSSAGAASILSCQVVSNSDQLCKQLGGVLSAAGQCQIPPDYSSICTQFGGKWSETGCALINNGNGTMNGPSLCATLGGSWSGSSCALASTGTPGATGKAGDSGASCPNSTFPDAANLAPNVRSGTTTHGNALNSSYEYTVSPCTSQCVSGVWTGFHCMGTPPSSTSDGGGGGDGGG